MKLFFCHARDDHAWTHDLALLLGSSPGYETWARPTLTLTADAWSEVCGQIETSEVFVFVMTPTSVASFYCLAELAYARALNRPILPLKLKPCAPPPMLPTEPVLPDDAKDLRVVAQQIATWIKQIRWRNYPPREVTRPAPPFPQQDAAQTFEVFTLAEEAASEGEIDQAVELFNMVVQADPDGLGSIASERRDIVLYERKRADVYSLVKRLASRSLTHQAARAAWRGFLRDFGYYDPDNLASQLSDERSMLPSPRQYPALPMRSGDQTPPTLPGPFEWVRIPPGNFSISRYPITNRQFAVFMEAGGYDERRWWTRAGWEQRLELGLVCPRYWELSLWNGPDQPVVGVSWYEAVAFSRWLSEITGEAITLPTENQWQQAAQGDDGRTYPWGDAWDCERCNNAVMPCSSGATTAVQQYADYGDSPYGVADMAGNVWEWCLTDYDTGHNDPDQFAGRRVMRGGAWVAHSPERFRTTDRYRFFPNYTTNYFGFRVVRLG